VAWVGVPIVLANIWLTGFLSARIPIKRMTAASALLTGVFIATVVVPTIRFGLFPVLFATGAVLAICLPSCATPLSNAAKAAEQGRVMGNNQALQVAAEALSGLAAGLLAAIIVKLPLSCSEQHRSSRPCSWRSPSESAGPRSAATNGASPQLPAGSSFSTRKPDWARLRWAAADWSSS
jgi:MFS family permease